MRAALQTKQQFETIALDPVRSVNIGASAVKFGSINLERKDESQFCYYELGQEFNITYQDLNLYLNRCINYITDHDKYHITAYELTNDIPLHLVKTTESNNLSMKE